MVFVTHTSSTQKQVNPLHHKVVSVTGVLKPVFTTADGLSTGLMVLGEVRGMGTANQHINPSGLWWLKQQMALKKLLQKHLSHT
ncbi:hypothetical protein O9929_04060 [Vibrio lentus]|nr:hypothetical protein [Vibrio lentus]